MKNNDSFGWCFIGCGSIAERVYAQMKDNPSFRIASVYSRSYDKARAFAAKTGAVACPSIGEALTAEGVRGAYIASPHAFHYEHAMEAISRKIPVLIEKPMTTSPELARNLTEAARLGGTYLAEAMWTRFQPVNRQVRSLLGEEVLGKIGFMSVNFGFDSDAPDSHRLFDPSAAGGALLDVGVYTVAYAQMAYGNQRPVKISASCEKHRTGVDARTMVTLYYEDGAVASTYCALTLQTNTSAALYGEHGSLIIPNFYAPDKLYVRLRGKPEETVIASSGFGHQFEKVQSDILAGKLESEEMTWEDSLTLAEILYEARMQCGVVYPFDKSSDRR